MAKPDTQTCLPCRQKHLKCDGKRPLCSRCVVTLDSYVYLRSRRGLVGGRRKQIARVQLDTVANQVQTDGNDVDSFHELMQIPQSIVQPEHNLHGGSPVMPSTSYNPPKVEEKLIFVYYAHIHPAHPFAIPRKLYSQDPSLLPDHLKGAMQRIASQWQGITNGPSAEELSVLIDAAAPHVFKVQTLLLLTMKSNAFHYIDECNQALESAIDTAYYIGLDQESFGHTDEPILRESWRRTWWELYSLASMISLLTPSISQLSPTMSRCLPVSCDEYKACNSKETKTLGDMQMRLISDDRAQYSSFAYRIEASRILHEVVVFNNSDASMGKGSEHATLAAAIQSYRLSLSTASGHVVDDEMMAGAVITVNVAAILLHLPWSNLDSQALKTGCDISTKSLDSSEQTVHTRAVLRAADAIAKSLTDRASMDTISPCSACALALAATVYLAACASPHQKDTFEHSKEHLHLVLSGLDAMRRSWPIAEVVRKELAQFARRVFQPQEISRLRTEEFDSPGVPNLTTRFLTNAGEDTWLADFIQDPTYLAIE